MPMLGANHMVVVCVQLFPALLITVLEISHFRQSWYVPAGTVTVSVVITPA